MKDQNQTKRTFIDFLSIDPRFQFTLGKVLHNKASLPLEEHVHPTSIEISYFIKGDQVYTVESKPFTIRSNELFVTFPGESHGSGKYQKDKSILYYMQIDTKLFEIIGTEAKEGESLLKKILQIEKRCFKPSKRVPILLDKILVEGQNPTAFSKIMIRNYISELIIEVIKGEEKNNNNETLIGSKWEVIEYIEHHIEENINIRDLASLMKISEGRFKILFKERVGIPPKEYILRQKIKVAKELLRNTDVSVTQIAYKLGFSSSQYFTTVFKRFNIDSPKVYRLNSKIKDKST